MDILVLLDCNDFNPTLNRDDHDADGFSTCDGDCDDNDPRLGPWDVDGDNYSTCDGDCRDDDSSITPRTDNDGDGFVYCDDCDDNDSLVYVGNAYQDSTTEYMIDIDEDGYGADLTLTSCLEIEMFDSTNRDWEGAAIQLHLGDKNESFSFDTELDPSLEFTTATFVCQKKIDWM